MASNSTAIRELARFGTRFLHRGSASPSPLAGFSYERSTHFRRNLHASMYDKNVDEHVRPAVVPDEVIKPESEKYWAPNPETGVFGPAANDNNNNRGHSPRERGEQISDAESVVGENVFFRPLEGLEKPQQP